MNCTHVQEALLAEPAKRSAEVAAHLVDCELCTAFAAELTAFESRLTRALAVPVPPRALPTRVELEAQPPAASVSPLATPRRSRRIPVWFAVAASGVLATLVLGALLTIYPRYALANALVGHVVGEPDSWAVTDARVPDEAVAYVLKRAGVALTPGGPPITYAQSCMFRGWRVPHLVVQTAQGPMTIMPLKHEHVSRPMPIDEDGYRGVILPAGQGALAVLAQGAGDPLAIEAIAAQAVAAVRFVD